MNSLGLNINLEDASQMISTADLDHSGQIEFEEFKRMLMGADV